MHRLVAIAFIPNPDNLPEVNHKNMDREDNRAMGLEWVSKSQNVKHSMASGSRKGVKINPHIASEIREDYSVGMKNKDLKEKYKKYKLASSTISQICSGKLWAGY